MIMMLYNFRSRQFHRALNGENSSSSFRDTVETFYSRIPYTTTFYITRWTHGPQNLQRPIRTLIVLLGFFNKTNLRVICLFTARASEWTHMWPATSVNNDDGTDYLRLSHLTTLSAGVNNYLRCIHKGLTAFSRVTPSIRVHDQTISTRSFAISTPEYLW